MGSGLPDGYGPLHPFDYLAQFLSLSIRTTLSHSVYRVFSESGMFAAVRCIVSYPFVGLIGDTIAGLGTVRRIMG